MIVASAVVHTFIVLFLILPVKGLPTTIPIGDDSHNCSHGILHLVESIPEGVELNTNETTYEGWMRILRKAELSIDMAIFYMTLTEGSQYPPELGGWMGENVFNEIINAHTRGVKVRIVQNEPSPQMPDNDTQYLATIGAAEVRSINWAELFEGGILHTKLIVVDSKEFYVGSANLDWRSLSQVKELGYVVEHCHALAHDMEKIFQVYWAAAEMVALPPVWPPHDTAMFNLTKPGLLTLNTQSAQVFIASSPAAICATDRTVDITALVNAINVAQTSVCISVMDYAPCTYYSSPNIYWPNIDDAIRAAAFRGVEVRMLISKWNHSNPIMFQYLNSLSMLTNIDVRLFEVPPQANSPVVPFTRVNHAKYMVTDQQAYVGTSNWSADYFTDTGGVSMNVLGDSASRDQLQAVFERDWNSIYAHELQP